ncbi:MAG: hypothetical protein MR902_02580 [Campylobacter sp.]|nr:hypothetical protein [Campylobacter sp.]
MKRIEVYITSKSLSRSYKIEIQDEEFATIFKKELGTLVDGGKFLDAQNLLDAYVKKSYENYLQLKKLNEYSGLIEKLDKI